MTCIVDATVLFPLLVEGHAAHRTARDWWSEQPDASVGICLVTSLAVLRLLTNHTAMSGYPVSAREACNAWSRLCEDPRTFHIDSLPVQELPGFTAMIASKAMTPVAWTHAWFSALAVSLGYEMVSFDSTFMSFRELKARLLQLEPPASG
jgi:uncharacterized protein